MAIIDQSTPTGALTYSLLQDVYLEKVINNKPQADKVLSQMKTKKWFGGKQCKYLTQVSNGGNFGTDWATIKANPTNGALNLEWAMEPFAVDGQFEIGMPDLVATEDRGAYMGALENNMSACFDGLAKTLALFYYGGRSGVIGRLGATVDGTNTSVTVATSNTFVVNSSTAIKMTLGTRFVVAQGDTPGTDVAYPESTLLGGNTTPVVFTVTAKKGTTITASASVTGGTIYAYDILELYTARSGSSFYGMEGIADIIPYWGNRGEGTGNTLATQYASYIGTNFRGLDRSQMEYELSGQFASAYGRTSATPLQDTLVDLLDDVTTNGAVDSICPINAETYRQVASEAGIQLKAAANSGDDKNRVTAGVSKLNLAFEDAFINGLIPSAYVPNGVAWIYDADDATLLDQNGAVDTILNKVGNDSLGKYEIADVGSAGISKDPMSMGVNLNKLFTITEGAGNRVGPTLNVAAHIFGNFMLQKTASSGVAHLNVSELYI